MAGTRITGSSTIVASRPPDHRPNAPGNRGTMGMQPNGNPAHIQFVSTSERVRGSLDLQPRAGAWDAVLAFFGIRKAPPMPKRPASEEARPDPAKLARENATDLVPVNSEPVPVEPAKPFPILDLPFELLCEVIAHLPPGSRHFLLDDAGPLGSTCKAFHAAVEAVANSDKHRDEDAVARRIGGIRWQRQITPMLDELPNARPSIREWAVRTLVTMTNVVSAGARLKWMVGALERAKAHSSLWELEVMRHLARHLPHTDTAALNLLTERAVQWVPANDEERFARTRVLAQLAQRISPNDLPGSVRRWESIYQLFATAPDLRYEDYLTLRGLEAGLANLKQRFRCSFNVGHPTGLLLSMLRLIKRVDRREADPYLAACTAAELERIAPPEPLPGTVPPPNPLRAYSSIMVRKVPRAERLPSHLT